MFFPLELMPHVTHPLMRRLGPEAERMVAARHLFQYLLFTTHFELGVVNRATARIAQGDIGIRLPNAARADALKIYTDEAYHALSSIDLVARLEAVVGIQALPYDFAPYLTRLDEVGRHALPGRLQLAQLLQVVVFETLVTSILTVVPADRTVLDIVRDTVADHAEDERRHHAYFSAFFRELWAGLDRAERAATARCLPQLIRQSLQPDLTPTSKALAAAGMKPSDIRTVLAESYSNDRQVREAAIIARHSVRLFRNCGVLDTPEAVDAFEAAGLLPRESPDSNSLEPAACGNAPGSRP
ncbi:MAG: diiron oxygenase [Jatrophihabitantaceae bacterium]